MSGGVRTSGVRAPLIICVFISTLTSIRTAVSILTVVYPKVVLTVVYILTVVSSLSDCSQQHSPHFYFHVIFISAYPYCTTLCICKCAWQKWALINSLFAGKESNRCKPATTYAKGRNHHRNSANDSFGKGFCHTRSSAASWGTRDKVCKGRRHTPYRALWSKFHRYFSGLGPTSKKLYI